jgi:hypothetical protein
MNNEAGLTIRTQPIQPNIVVSSSDIAKFAEMFEILISIDRRLRKEASNENHGVREKSK